MAYTTIDDPSTVFQCELWTGNGSNRSITLSGNSDLQPDMVWIKQRNGSENHNLFDSVRGAGKRLIPNLASTEATVSDGLTSFNSDGFSLATGDETNKSSSTYVSWNWKEQAGVFDIVTYTGNGSGRTISHSLGVKPSAYILKDRAGDGWYYTDQSIGFGTHAMVLQDVNAAFSNSTYFNNTAPTSSVFSVGTDGGVNANGHNFMAYLFANKQGVSKVGSYTGNGNANGTFIYTGFSPAWLMIKQTAASNDWFIIDNKREPFNPNNVQLVANGTGASTNKGDLDLLSNGFKPRSSNAAWNENNAQYIYMAFAEQPFVTSTGVPATAR